MTPRMRLFALAGTLALTLTIAVAAGGARGALASLGTPTAGQSPLVMAVQ
jgi:hypothetical protein